MEKIKKKSLIDRFWWIIPPMFLTFVYWPLIHYMDTSEYLSFERYIRTLEYLVIVDGGNVGLPTFFWSYFIFGFMAIGMLLTRKRSLALRIIVPILFGILGSFIGIPYGMSISSYALD